MPMIVKCPCGKQYEVGGQHRQEQIRCSSCGRTLAVSRELALEGDAAPLPAADEPPLDDLEVLEQVDERERPVERRASLPPVGPRCYLCDGEGKGKSYHFFAGWFESTLSYGNVVTTRYKNLQKYEIYLCQECAVAGWKRIYKVRVVLWGGGLFVPLLGVVLVLAGVQDRPLTLLLLIILVVLSIGLIAGLIHSVLKCLAPPDRDRMERLAIRWARRDEDFADAGDVFFTSNQFRNLKLN